MHIRQPTREEIAEFQRKEALQEARRKECAKRGHYSTAIRPSFICGNTGVYTCAGCGSDYMRKISEEEAREFWKELDSIPLSAGVA